MKKLLILSVALLCVTSFAFANGAAETGSAKTLNLVVAQNQTSAENPYSIGIKAFKDKVEELSGGQVTATCYNGTLGESESELIEKLQVGAASMVVASPGFMASIGVPEVNIFSLEYLFDSFDHWETCLDGEFGNSLNAVISEKTNNDFKIMDYWSASVRDYYGKKVIYKPSDLKGMTIRIQSSPVQQEFWKACGAIPTSVAWGELYQALQQGVVDSAENDYTNFSLKDHHKTKNGHYICETDHDYTTRLLLMDGNYFGSLTADQQKWIQEAADYATKVERKSVMELYKVSKQKCLDDGATIVNKADMDIAAFQAIAYPIQDKFASENHMEKYLQMVREAK